MSSTDLPLLLPDERDDRFEGVVLLWHKPEDQEKRTADRRPHGWYIEEWRVVGLDGQDYWTSGWGFFIDSEDLATLARLHQEHGNAQANPG